MKTDAELMTAFREGDAEAFEKLVLRHQMGLFNFFYRLVGDRQTAEDQTQEVFFKLYLHAGNYVETAKFTTYLYKIAKNCWIDFYRRRKRRASPRSLDVDVDEGLSLHERIPADVEPPAARMERWDRQEVVMKAVAALPEEQRMVFVLSEVQGMKYAEIAQTLDIPVGTVKSRMHVAVNRLRESLTRAGIMGAD